MYIVCTDNFVQAKVFELRFKASLDIIVAYFDKIFVQKCWKLGKSLKKMSQIIAEPVTDKIQTPAV